ncbi:MAG: hypothetical protein HF973_04760 [Chloroflexi bacterium]|nr:hypothetical protein [Chloroflexota bacterium]
MATVTLDIPDYLASAVAEIGDKLPLVLEMGFSRLAPVSTKAYMEALSLLTQYPTPEMIAEFRFSDEVEARINALLEKNESREISKAEEVELDRLCQLEEQLQLVKARAFMDIN